MATVAWSPAVMLIQMQQQQVGQQHPAGQQQPATTAAADRL
jgi:hypothetical protein